MSTNPSLQLNLHRLQIIGSAVLGFAFLGGLAATLGMNGSLHYPQALIALIALLFFVAAGQAQREPVPQPPVGAGAPTDAAGGGVALACMIVLCVIYILSWSVIGYFPSTFVFALAQLWVMRQRRWPVLLGVPLAVTLVVYVVFYRLLQLPFPAGRLFG